MRKALIDFYRDSRNEWRWRMKYPNGKIACASSEGYKEKADMVKNFHFVCLSKWSISNSEDDFQQDL